MEDRTSPIVPVADYIEILSVSMELAHKAVTLSTNKKVALCALMVAAEGANLWVEQGEGMYVRNEHEVAHLFSDLIDSKWRELVARESQRQGGDESRT